MRTLPNHLRSGWILPCYGSVGACFIFFISGLDRYILSLLIVARVLNCEPGLPPDGSGLFGFELALPLEKAEAFFYWSFLPILWILPDLAVSFYRYCEILVAFLFGIRMFSAFKILQIK